MTSLVSNPPTLPTDIRLFVSSTFEDLSAEREELARTAFPPLRAMTEERGVTFDVVDLRWGITDDQAENDQALGICLREVDECSFFLGIVGGRYGSIPGKITAEVANKYPWLRKYPGRSITELEIRKAVLDATERHVDIPAQFYFREPSPACDDGKESHELLNKLKAEIRQHPRCRVRDDRNTVQEFALAVQDDLARWIDVNCQSTDWNSYEQETVAHWQYASNKGRAYVGNMSDWNSLGISLRRRKMLYVTGESSTGKSTLLANWLAYYHGSRVNQPHRVNQPLLTTPWWYPRRPMPRSLPMTAWLYHFAEATPRSGSLAEMLKRFTQLLHVELERDDAPSDDTAEIRRAFLSAVHAYVKKHRLIIVVDGIDQMHVDLGLGNLSWLPRPIPEGCHVIISGRQKLDAAPTLGKPQQVKLRPFSRRQRGKLVESLLRKRMSRQLSRAALSDVSASTRHSDPHLLTALVEELRVVESHEALPHRLREYLDFSDKAEFYLKVLKRLRHEYDTPVAITKRTFGMLWASRDGLSESELRDLLGRNGEPLPSRYWSPFIATIRHLLDRRGLQLFLGNGSVRAAVAEFVGELGVDRVRWDLAAYWHRKKLDQRAGVELPWILSEQQQWQSLSSLITSRDFIEVAWPRFALDLKSYLSAAAHALEQQIPALFDNLQEDDGWAYLWPVCCVFRDTGFLDDSLRLSNAILRHPTIPTDRLIELLELRFDLLLERGNNREVAAVLAAYESLVSSLGNNSRLARAKGMRGALLRADGDLQEAIQLFEAAAESFGSIGDVGGQAKAFGEIGKTCYEQGFFRRAADSFAKQKLLSKELGDFLLLRESLENECAIFVAQDEFDKAIEGYREALAMSSEAGDFKGTAVILGNLSLPLMDLARYDDAMDALDEAQRIFEELGDPRGQVLTIHKQIRLFGFRMRQFDYGLKLAQRAMELSQRHGMGDLEQRTLTLVAEIHRQQTETGASD